MPERKPAPTATLQPCLLRWRCPRVEPHLPEPLVTCLTAAQAAHWFDLDVLYQEAHRAVRPGGVVALWCYGNMGFPQDKDKDKAIGSMTLDHKIKFYDGTLEGCWDDRRHLVERMYQDLPLLGDNTKEFQGQRLNNPSWDIRSVSQLVAIFDLGQATRRIASEIMWRRIRIKTHWWNWSNGCEKENTEKMMRSWMLCGLWRCF